MMLYFPFQLNAQQKVSDIKLKNPYNEVQQVLIGQKIPPSFWTKEHLFLINGDTTRGNLSDYKDKLLILSFWSTTCSSCFMNKSKIEEFVKRSKGEIATIMINSKNDYDSFDAITSFLSKQNYVDTTQFSSIVLDEYLAKLFPHHGYPYYAWISNYGTFYLGSFKNLLDQELNAPYLRKNISNRNRGAAQ